MTGRKPFGRLHANPERCQEGRSHRAKATWAEDDLRGVARRLARNPDNRSLQNALSTRRATRERMRDQLAAHLAECKTCTDAEAATT